MKRVLLVGKNGRVEKIDAQAVKQFGGIARLLKDLHEHEAQCQRDFNARMMRPQMPRIAS